MVGNDAKPHDMLSRIQRDLPDLLGSLDTIHAICQYRHPNETFYRSLTLRVVVVDEEANNESVTAKMKNLVARHNAYVDDQIQTRDGITEDGRLFVDFTAGY